jgi:hypothetical protein
VSLEDLRGKDEKSLLKGSHVAADVRETSHRSVVGSIVHDQPLLYPSHPERARVWEAAENSMHAPMGREAKRDEDAPKSVGALVHSCTRRRVIVFFRYRTPHGSRALVAQH